MQQVKSKNIHAVGHDGTTLTIQFKDKEGKPGATWSYHGVPADEHRDMMASISIGGYFSVNIRHKYKGTKHEE